MLLALAEREEVDIFKVSLAKVTDAYLAEVASREIAEPQEKNGFASTSIPGGLGVTRRWNALN